MYFTLLSEQPKEMMNTLSQAGRFITQQVIIYFLYSLYGFDNHDYASK